jgi:ABC-type bacteriocin/lantibiotic exporter with double-glycine peptidase domain
MKPGRQPYVWVADDIAAMPMQMHTVISEGGGNISGGQRQRLLIARGTGIEAPDFVIR